MSAFADQTVIPIDFDSIASTFGADNAMGAIQELHAGWEYKKLASRLRQNRIAQANARLERAAIEGIGELQLSIDPDIYHYWGQQLGYECWEDEEFRREFARDNEAARVKNVARKTTIIHPGMQFDFNSRR